MGGPETDDGSEPIGIPDPYGSIEWRDAKHRRYLDSGVWGYEYSLEYRDRGYDVTLSLRESVGPIDVYKFEIFDEDMRLVATTEMRFDSHGGTRQPWDEAEALMMKTLDEMS